MCREKISRCVTLVSARGAPLRVQGKVKIQIHISLILRITPACAGKRLWILPLPRTTRDHPCVCREKFHFTAILMEALGSPLRVQGKDGYKVSTSIGDRITPACAGKSAFCLVIRTSL